MAAKQRAETRFKNKASEELVVFTTFLNRFNKVISEVLPPETYRALQKRFERDLSEVPTRLIE